MLSQKAKAAFLAAVSVLCLVSASMAATYYVDSANGNDANDGSATLPWRTIQKAANTVTAGDTALVRAGSYDEFVLVANSGIAGKPIVFKSTENAKMPGFSISGKNFVTINGFEVTDQGFSNHGGAIYVLSTHGIEISNNHIHNTLGTAVTLRYHGPSNYAIIRNNLIVQSGYAGMEVCGNNNLVENNDISHADNFIQLQGSNNVIRNNVFHDVSLSDWATPTDPHIDGIETSPSPGEPPHRGNLIENNRMVNGVDPNTHFMLLRNVSHAVVSDQIVRYNTISNIGSGFICLGGPVDTVTNTKIYNNTLVNDVVAGPEYVDLAVCAGCPGTKIVNNLFYNNVVDNGFVFYVAGNPDPGFYAGYNLDYLTSCGGSCAWQNTTFPYLNTILNQDPLLENDLGLQAQSPAIEKGGPLTQVSSLDPGSGTNLIVDDAGMFQDGEGGIVEPDWIAVGNVNNTVQIDSIDLAAGTIRLTIPLSRTAGDPVWLYKDSNGRRVLFGSAPDIGAHPYGAGTSEEVSRVAAISTVSVYPNPARSVLTVAISGAAGLEFSVYASDGRKMHSTVLSRNAQHCRIAAEKWPAGVYIWRISGGLFPEQTGRFFVLR